MHPVLCAVDRGMIRGMMSALYGASASRLEGSLLDGGDVCVTAVDAPVG